MKGFLGVVTALSLAMFLVPSVSMAWWGNNHYQNGGDEYNREVRVRNNNSASIMNVVDSSANTGHNYADGSYAGDGARGGDIDVEQEGQTRVRSYRGHGSYGGDAGVENTGTGDGGDGGWSSAGGFVGTGLATTNTEVMNMANSNDTRVSDDCGCEADGDRNINVRVSNRNSAHVFNAVASSANTGHNYADGSYAGDGARGGDIDVVGRGAEVERSGTGDGGNGGNSGQGGEVLTGDAHTSTNVVTVVNRNVTRVR